MKFSFLAGFAAGYVLGTKADPQRYEQIKAAAVKVKENPTVQQTTQQVTETVKGKANEAVSRAKSHNGSTSTPGTSTPGMTTPGTSTPGTSTPGTSTSGTSTSGTSTSGTAAEPSPLLAARTADPLEVPDAADDELGSRANDPFNTRP
jgi:hypothetical protein